MMMVSPLWTTTLVSVSRVVNDGETIPELKVVPATSLTS